MFGYLTANQDELKVKELRRYRAYYCGLCHSLRKRHGLTGQLTLSFDMTFAAMLFGALYEPKTQLSMRHCIPHPVSRHQVLSNPCIDYAADMNLLLTYEKCLDDWHDDRSIKSLGYAVLLKRGMRKLTDRYPEKVFLIKDKLAAITACEKKGETNPDIPAGLFGDIMAEILAIRNDEWEGELRRLGFFLGKFIYLLDAYDDLEDDRTSGSYNVLLPRSSSASFDEDVLSMLTLMAAESARSFERLPILKDAAILRNILYSGIWVRYRRRTSVSSQSAPGKTGLRSK